MKVRVLSHIYRSTRISGTITLKKNRRSEKGPAVVCHYHSPRFQSKGLELFKTFRKRWGVASAFRGAGYFAGFGPGKTCSSTFRDFQKESGGIRGTRRHHKSTGSRRQCFPNPGPDPAPQQTKSLKERIDEARTDPDIPQPVIELIEKNKMNAAGQSGAKYYGTDRNPARNSLGENKKNLGISGRIRRRT